MAGDLLLDTNIVVAMVKGEAAVLEIVGSAERVFIPSIVPGELYFGAFKSTRAAENVSRVDELAKDRSVLGCDVGTSRHYGELKSALRAKGRPIPENDVWIAALAVQHGLTLVSRDEHFRQVEGLKLESVSSSAG